MTTVTSNANFSIYQNPNTTQIFHNNGGETEITAWPVTIINGKSPLNETNRIIVTFSSNIIVNPGQNDNFFFQNR